MKSRPHKPPKKIKCKRKNRGRLTNRQIQIGILILTAVAAIAGVAAAAGVLALMD